MYARRAALATFNSLKRNHKVCGRNHTGFYCALRIHDFVRNFGTAPERSDVYSNYDRNTAENQSGDSCYSQIDQFYGTNLGEFQQWQNPSRVYEKRINSDSFNQNNHSDCNYGNLEIDRGELNQGPNRVHGRSSVLQHVIGEVKRIENINGLISSGSLGTPPHNHDGVHWENSRGDFAGGSNYPGSYSRNEDKPGQNVALNYHSDERNYQQNLGAFQSGGITDSQTTTDMKFNVGPVEVSQESKLEGRSELNQILNRVHGQSSVLQHVIGEVKRIENLNGLGSRGSLGTSPHNHDGVHWENSSGDFAGGSNYPGSYSRNEDMPVQNVVLNFHSDERNYQQNLGAFQSGGITDSQTTTDMKFNAGSVDVSQEGKLEDRSELNQRSNRVPGQNSVLQHVIGEVKQIENFNGLGSRGSLGTPPHNHDGVHWENSSGDFAGGSNYPGSYSRNEDMPVQNVALNYHSDERNYLQNLGAFQSGGITGSQTTNDMKSNAGSVEVSQQGKLEDCGELNQRSNHVHGQNSVLQRVIGEVKRIENINGLGSRGSLGTPPHNHDGVHWENSRGDFAGGSNYPGSYSRNEAMPVQNVALNYHSDEGNYQRNSGAFQSGGITDSQTTTGMKFNAGSVEVSQEGKLEDRGELNQSSNRVHGQNSVLPHVIGEVKQIENFNGLGSRGSLGTPPHNHDGVHWENSSEDFAGGSNYPGSYRRNEDMPVQNVALNHHSNERNYQQNMGAFQSGGITDSQTTTDMKFNAGSVEVSQESKLEDLDKFIMEGKLKEAVELLGLLQRERVQVELPRYTALMKACGENEALDMAKSVHEHLLNSGVHLETSTFNQILEMYSKCGSMNDAFQVFDQMPMRNLTTWDIMISWLAKNDLGEDSLELFAEFKRSGLKPDGEMFIGVFSACGVLCDTVEGMLHFESMIKDYGIVPTMNHYVGIVGMLGNAGCLDEALEFIEKMPVEPSVAIWETLMKFCRIHGNTVLGDRCADYVALLDPSRLNEQSQAGLIPISAADIAREKEKKKLSGQNPLDIRSRVHEYRAGDRSPDNDRIYELLRGLRQQMKEVGYVPETKFVLHDVDIEVKEEALMAHSERLAAAQGFLTSAARSPLRIIKNLRFCGDCHNAFKIISKIVGREITARDSKRFHHFRDGSCSCNDFW